MSQGRIGVVELLLSENVLKENARWEMAGRSPGSGRALAEREG